MNQTNETYQPLDFWFKIFGSLWIQDVLNLGLIPLGLIAMTFNILSFVIFSGRQFYSSSIYEYLRAYSLNSACICLLTSTRFIGNSEYFFSFSNNEWATRYIVNFFTPIINTLMLYQTFLDLVLSFDIFNKLVYLLYFTKNDYLLFETFDFFVVLLIYKI
jgi:hypothetical protein